MTVKVSKKLISEFVNSKGLELFDFNGLMDAIDDQDILKDIEDSSFNPGFKMYSNHHRNNELAVNVKTYFGCKSPFNAIPDFIKTEFDESTIDNAISQLYEDTTRYTMEYNDWAENNNLKAEFGCTGRSGGYWTIKNIKSYDAFEPADNKVILEGLKSHLSKQEMGNEYDTKEEMFQEFEEQINFLADIYSYDREGHLDYIKNDLGLINYTQDFKNNLVELYNTAKSKVEFYEYKPNIVKEVLNELTLENENGTRWDLLKNYDDYVFKKEIELTGIELDKQTSFDFKDGKNLIKFDIDTKYHDSYSTFATIKIQVNGEPYNKDKHENIKINGRSLEEYNINPVGYMDYRKLEQKDVYSKIGELLNFKDLIELNGQERTHKIFDIIGTIKPENINKEFYLEDKVVLNKKENKFELKTEAKILDRTDNSITTLNVKNGKIDYSPIIEEIKNITSYNHRVNEMNKNKNDPNYDYYNPINVRERNEVSYIERSLKPFEILNNISPTIELNKSIDLNSQEYRYNWIQSELRQSNHLNCIVVEKLQQQAIKPGIPKKIDKGLDIG